MLSMWNNSCDLVIFRPLEVIVVRLRGGMFVEFCIGIGAVLLIAAAFFYFMSVPARDVKETSARDAELAKRYKTLSMEISESEKGMEIRENEGVKQVACEETDGEYEMCSFAASVWLTSADISLHTTIGFVRGEDASIEKIFLLADDEEYELPLGNAKRETEALDEERVGEKIELLEDDSFRQLRQAAKAERITVRFQGADEASYAQLTETQVQNLKRVLRLFELYREAWAVGELREMQ